MRKNKSLRLYFVGNDEDGGQGVLAFNCRQAKKLAWPFIDSSSWLDVNARLIRDARIEHVKNPELGHILTYTEGLKSGVYGPNYDDEGPECLRCNSSLDCRGCAYRDNWLGQ